MPDETPAKAEIPSIANHAAFEIERQLAQPLAPGLHLVATPIGHLADISLRAIATLARADIVYCEDTRHSRTLLAHYGIRAKLRAYHEHNAETERPRILAELAAGHAVVFDGVSAKADERESIANIAAESGCTFFGLWLEAPLDTQIARVDTRRGDASDSDAAVVRMQAERDLGPITWARIDAAASPAETLAQAKQALGLPACTSR